MKDIVDRKVRFVNRDHDSGTRLLFDQLLALHGIDEAQINGAQQIEFTHAAVAAYVASGMADVELRRRSRGAAVRPRLHTAADGGLFLSSAAQTFLETEPMQRVLDIMKGSEFQKAVAALPGYKATDTGVVHSVKEFLNRLEASQ